MNRISPAFRTIMGFLAANKRDCAILSSLYLFHVITTYIWLKLDTLVLIGDSAKFYLISLKIGDALGFHSILDVLNPAWLWRLPETTEVIRPIWAPFSQAIVTPFYAIFGRAPDTAVLIQYAIFYLILIISVYGIGKKLFSRNVGLLAAFITTMYPIVLNPYYFRCQERLFSMDMPLAAMVALSLYALLLTNYFKNRTWSVLFGVTLALGWLTKLTFPLYIIAPVLLVVWLSFSMKRRGFVQNVKEHKRQIVNMLLLLIGLAPAILYWAPILGEVLAFYLEPWEAYAMPQYFPIILIESMSSFLLIVSMAASLYLVYLVCRKSLSWKDAVFLFLWIIIPTIALSIFFHRKARFIIPVLPALALISAVALERIRFAKLKVCLVSLVVVVSLVQFSSFSFGVPSLPSGTVALEAYLHYPAQDYLFPDGGEPKQEWMKLPTDKNLDEVMELIIYGESTGRKLEEYKMEMQLASDLEWLDRPWICAIPNGPYLTHQMRYYLYRHAPYLRLCELEVDTAAYVVTFESGVWGYSNYRIEERRQAQEYLEEHIEEYELLGTLELPDGDKILVYHNKSTPTYHSSAKLRTELLEVGLGRSWQPDTDLVAITSIHPDRLSYHPDEEIAVIIGLKNVGDTPYDGEVRWALMKPGYTVVGEKGSEMMHSEEDVSFTLGVGEEVEVSLGAIIPPTPGSYELAAGVRVYTTEQPDKLAHSDVAFHHGKIKIEIKGRGMEWGLRYER